MQQNEIIVTAAQMQQLDRRTIESFKIPGRVLMENAGRGAVRFFRACFSKMLTQPVGILAGRGNNGGDGFVVARYLHSTGTPVTVFLLTDPKRLGGDAAANYELLQPMDIPVVVITDEKALAANRERMEHQRIWVDALLGTGLNSEVKGFLGLVIDFVNQSDAPVFSIDIPSGLHADTGQPMGRCIRADATATFGFAKIGHHQYPGVELTGKLDVIDIGIPPHITAEEAPQQYRLSGDQVRADLPRRLPHAHKGTTGHLLVIAGSPGKTGAAIMTAQAAQHVGAGLVTLAAAGSLQPVLASQLLEPMTAALAAEDAGFLTAAALPAILELAADKTAVAIGPGIGTHPETRRLVRQLIASCPCPMVIDADGLNCIAKDPGVLKNAKVPVVITPHPGEMARLLGGRAADVQVQRLVVTRDFAAQYQVEVVLKGAATVIAHPDGRAFVNPTGNAGMACGGMGDVLTGIIAGLAAQGAAVEAAARAGVYLHGDAADRLCQSVGPRGYVAGDVLRTLPSCLCKLLVTGEEGSNLVC